MAEFLNDIKTQDAVIRNFEIIGEAAKRISDDTRHLAPELPWRHLIFLIVFFSYAGRGLQPLSNVKYRSTSFSLL